MTSTPVQSCTGVQGSTPCVKQSGFLALEDNEPAGMAEGDSDKWPQVSAAWPA